MELPEIIGKLEQCNFTCVAGPLENSAAFIALREKIDNEKVCCLGADHPCPLNVNNGYCTADECQYQVQAICRLL